MSSIPHFESDDLRRQAIRTRLLREQIGVREHLEHQFPGSIKFPFDELICEPGSFRSIWSLFVILFIWFRVQLLHALSGAKCPTFQTCGSTSNRYFLVHSSTLEIATGFSR